MKKLFLILTLVSACAMPACASAEAIEVNTLADLHLGGAGCPGLTGECSLSDAIFKANETESPDEIVFTIAGTIEVEELMPHVNEPLTIDASSAPGYEAAAGPVVTLDGAGLRGQTEGAPEIGLQDDSAGGATIIGLAFVDFETAIVINEDGGLLCANYVGTDSTGTGSSPNQVGVRVTTAATGAQIGRGCPDPNLISGNRGFAVVIEGAEAGVGHNLIGVAPGGDEGLPNGGGAGPGGGILVASSSEETSIGAIGEEGLPNTIAHNDGPGIAVESGARGFTIFNNSIFDNAGLGIEISPTAGAPQPPVITSLEGAAVEGTVTGAPNSAYLVEFFAGRECDPSGAGEGEISLEGATESVATNAEGRASFQVTLPERPADAGVVTATVTSLSNFDTSEFSSCAGVPPPPPPPPSPVETLIPPSPPLVGAINGASIAVAPAAGIVRVKAPGDKDFHELIAGELIPVGSIVDASKGRVTLTSVDAHGNLQTADFYGGVFKVLQKPGSTLVVLKLLGPIGPCPKAGSSAIVSSSGGRHLWGSGKGSFRTEGRYGAATVRGTIWLTADRCAGTFFKVKRGVVSIRDFAKRGGITLRAGDTYLASPG